MGQGRIRALRGPGGKWNIKTAFILVNIGLFVVAALWLYPTAASWQRARELTRHQRQVYAAYSIQAQAQQYPQLEGIWEVLPYGALALHLEGVENLARLSGLETRAFTTTGPVGYNCESGERFVEIRVQASFLGMYCQSSDFTYGLAGSAAFLRELSMEFLDAGLVNLWVEFSLFGREE